MTSGSYVGRCSILVTETNIVHTDNSVPDSPQALDLVLPKPGAVVLLVTVSADGSLVLENVKRKTIQVDTVLHGSHSTRTPAVGYLAMLSRRLTVKITARGMRLTAKQAVALIGGLVTLVSFARVVVLFLEALSAVRIERAADVELLELCAQGSASESMKMRSACLQARADRASPILLKAVLRAVSTAFEDFSDSVSSPGKLLVVVLFVLSSVFLPMNSWIKTLFPPDEHIEGNGHVVVVAHDVASALGRPRLNFRRRVAGALRMRKHRPFSPSIEEIDDFDVEGKSEDHLVDVDLSHKKWD
jgi:hypothetical protein